MSANGYSNGVSGDLRYVPLSYNNAESRTSALRLVLTIFPDWEHSEGDVEFVRFTDGITNTLLKAVKRRPGYTDEQIDKEAVLLRAYGKGTEVLIDREREATSHSLLSQHNLAPPLLARFHNGLMYRFIQGHVCSPEDLAKESVWRGVARRLGQWHAVLPTVSRGPTTAVQNGHTGTSLLDSRLESAPPLETLNAITPGKPTPNIWTVMQKWILALPVDTDAERQRQPRLQKELKQTVKELGDRPGLGKDGLVFGHCDLLSGNLIIPSEKGSKPPTNHVETVKFIDYEYATPSPAAFDIANHFAEWGGFDCNYHVLPTRSQRRRFVREYLASYYSHLLLKSVPVADSEVDRLFDEVDLFRGIPGFYWGIWALIQATISQIDFDYAAYAEIRLGEYWAWRDEVEGTRARAGKEMGLRERRWAQEE
ncbi:choline ethanolamine kinase [Lasallia pustulata]|uniref:ethanolamine kinase n=1 Tax=Lasallia pustulata TaxID=136370 RepID=A0A1W5D368_9LECA|nr:choline ethanolamine kinase [Lasallia pustulata]